MKKTLAFMIMAAALLLTQCKKPSITFPTPSVTTTVSMTITAGPGSKTDISTMGGIVWSENDKIYVGDGSKYVGYLSITSGVGNATGTFTGDVTVATGTHTFHFYYLGSAKDYSTELTTGESASTSVAVDFSSQDIYEENGKLKNASGQHVGYGKAENVEVEADKPVTGLQVSMKSKVAIAYFCFQKGEGESATPYEGALTLSGDHIYNKMTVNFSANDFSFSGTKGDISLANTTTHLKYAMLVPAGTDSETLNFGGAYEGTTTLANGIEANKFYRVDGSMPIVVTVEVVRIPVTGVSLNKSTLSLAAGATETLTATVAPDDATNKSVTWDSSDESVAKVADGTVTAVAVGTATITVTTVDGGKTATCAVTVTAPSYLPGEFTINSGGTKVKFSKGNLYYDGATDNKWKFEANQYDFRTYNGQGSCINGTYNSGSGTPSGDWGLFGWSTGAANNNWGMHTKTTSTTGYTDGDFRDWGGITDLPDNAGGNTWRTLSKAEWDYLLNTRTTSVSGITSNARYAEVKVNGVCGMMLFPDTFTWPSGVTSKPETFNTYHSNWNNVDYVAADFGLLESAGAVFLPAAGYRNGTDVSGAGSSGSYWSGTPYEGNEDYAYRMDFYSGYVYVSSGTRVRGYSVRLVRSFLQEFPSPTMGEDKKYSKKGTV